MPTSGKVYLNNVDVYSSHKVLAGKIGYCTSRDVLYEDLTVSEFLNFIACMKGVPNPHEHVMQIMKRCELTTHANFLIKTLSGGTKRRTTIAGAVIGEPQIIVMDEPSSGVDPENRRQLWKLIESLKNEKTALILTTHHLEEAEYLSNDVIILDRGQLEIRGTPSEICQKFGIGYRISIDSLSAEHESEQIKSSLKNIFNFTSDEEIQFNDSHLLTQGKINFIVPLSKKHKMAEIIGSLEASNYKYNIEANTLEDAFI